MTYRQTCSLLTSTCPASHSPVLHGCLPPLSSTPAQHHPRTNLQQSSGTSRLVPDILAQGGGHISVFLGVTGSDMTMKTSHNPSSPTQSSLWLSAVWFCHRVCVFCLSAFFSFFFVANTLTSQDVARGSPSLPVEWGVSMASVDDNKHRLTCLTYHGVIWWEIIYSANAVIWNLQVCSTCL